MTRNENKVSGDEMQARRLMYRKMSQSSEEQGVFFTDEFDEFTESDIFEDDSEHFGKPILRHRSTRRGENLVGGASSWLAILKKVGLLMELLSRMPLPPANVGGIAGATFLLTFFGPRALVQTLVYPVYRHVIGCLYPAYSSYKAVRSKNVREYVKWMMYWIVFAIFTCLETLADVFVSWVPFYYEAKVLIVLWLLSPTTKGSSVIYKKILHPALSRREQEIDEVISRARDRGYHTVLQLGSKGVNYATNVIVQTALKGSGGLMHQLRKTHSLSDIPETDQQSMNPQWPAVTQEVNQIDDDTVRVNQDSDINGMIGNPNERAVLLLRKKPDVLRQRPISYTEDGLQDRLVTTAYKLRRKTSDEGTSSGYSSSGRSEPGTPRRKEDVMLWPSGRVGINVRRTPTTITEDTEFYADGGGDAGTTEDYLINKQMNGRLYPSLQLHTNPVISNDINYSYENLTITDITNEEDCKTTNSLDTIAKNEINRISSRDLKDGNIHLVPETNENHLISKQLDMLMSPATEELILTTDAKDLESNKNDISKLEIIVPEESIVKEVVQMAEVLKSSKFFKESTEDDSFFDVINESTDVEEEFTDCENIISGNISIRITQDVTDTKPEAVYDKTELPGSKILSAAESIAEKELLSKQLHSTAEKLALDKHLVKQLDLQVRQNSLTLSTDSSSLGSNESMLIANLSVTPSKKTHVLGKGKAPEPPQKQIDETTSDLMEKVQTKTSLDENTKIKKKSGSPSAMSKLKHFPGKILPFLSKSEEQMGNKERGVKNKVPDLLTSTSSLTTLEQSSVKLIRASSGADIENNISNNILNSADQNASRIYETDV